MLSTKRFLRAALCTVTATAVFIVMRSIDSLSDWANILITLGVMFTVDSVLFRVMKSNRFKHIFYSAKSNGTDGDVQ